MTEVAAAAGVSPEVIALSGLFALVYLYTGESQLTIGVTTDDPEGGSIRRLAAPPRRILRATVPMGSELTFRDLFHRAQGTLQSPVAPTDPPDRVTGGGLSGVRILFSFEDTTSSWHSTDSLLNSVPGADLGLAIASDRGPLPAALAWSADVFDEPTVVLLSERLTTVYRVACRSPMTPMSRLHAELTSSDRASITNVRRSADARSVPVTDHIERQVRDRPDEIALAGDEWHLSYRDLHDHVTRIAHALRGEGAGSEQIVGVAIERSAELIVGLLGVLRAGAAYLPLDPTWPPHRLKTMVQETDVRTILVSPRTASLAVTFDRQIVEVQCGPHAEIPATPIPQHLSALDERTLAYVIYTSGSTGRPKGVMVTHANLAYSTQARIEAYDVQPGRFLLLSPFTFDSSIAAIFWSLCVGGTLILPPEGMQREPDQLVRFARATQPTHLLCLPSLLAVLLDAGLGAVKSLKTVIVAGEACPAELIDLAAAHGVRLFVEWGTTECSVWSTLYEGEGTFDAPLGKPIPGTQVHVVRGTEPVVPGGVGELLVGGPGVARGYHSQPHLTAERFVPAFLGGGVGLRLYRTGDRGRIRPDGALQFMGRVDDQIKVRGFRVEPREVEAALRRCEYVLEAVVLGAAGASRLEAFVATDVKDAKFGTQLRESLREQLPDYMIPSRISVVPFVPRLPNGKIDRQTLSERSAHTSPNFDDDLTPVEQGIRDIWRDVLGIDSIDPQDDFFMLGGHSLTAMRTLAEIRRRTRIDLTVRDIFEHRVLSDLARFLEAAATTRAASSTSPDS